MLNSFYKNNGPLKISEILSTLDIKVEHIDTNSEINDIKDLSASTKLDVTFFHSQKYKELAKKTKASYCITTEFLRSFISLILLFVFICSTLISKVFKISEIFRGPLFL